MSVVAVVFARGGSRGVPGKNLADVAGRSLLARAIDCARAADGIDRVVVSTDSAEIAAAALAAGAEVPFLRPAALAADDSPEWEAWRHAITTLREAGDPVDVLVSVPTTSPLRVPADVEATVATLVSGDWDAVVTVTPAHRHPAFNMVRLEAGRAFLADPAGRAHRRQDVADLFDLCTVAYAARPDYVLSSKRLLDGRVGAVVVPQERSLDIDTPYDLHLARLLLEHAGR